MRQPTDRDRLNRFLRALGRRLRRPARLYLVGGSVADADDPRALEEMEQAIRALKEEIDVNVEPASPADFPPFPRSVVARSRFVAQHGALAVSYYHLPSQVIAKAARGLEQDLADAERLVRDGEVARSEVEAA